MSKPALARLRFVFRSAFCLNLPRLKNSIGTQPSIRQGLRIIAEGVRKRIAAGVDHIQGRGALVEHEGDLATIFHDGARLDISSHAETLSGGGLAHALQLRYGFVVSLGFFYSTHCKPE